LENLAKLHQAVHAAGAVSIAITVPEREEEMHYPLLRAIRMEINDGLARQVAMSNGNMLLADAAYLLPLASLAPEERKLRFGDGTHLTPQGYRELATVIHGAMHSASCSRNGSSGRALKS
jgi:lysophospholipase L1-like esterase